MTTKHFFVSLAWALGVIVAFNVFLAIRMDTVPKLIMRQMRATPRIDILFLGNSLMQSGLDANTFTKEWTSPNAAPVPFNAGLGSSSPVEHYLLAKQAYLHHEPIPYLVYGFYNLQLTKPQSFAWSDLVGNRAMGYSTDPSKAASLYAPGSLFERWRFELIGAAPMLREHSELWKYVEIFRRKLQEVGMAKAKTNEFGRIADFETFAQSEQAQFGQDCEKAVKDQTPFVLAIQTLLQLAHEHNTQVIFIEMPMTSDHRTQYYSTLIWQQYQSYLQQSFKAEGALFINANDWVSDEDFSDGLHLNEAGAAVFSTKIAQVMAEKFKSTPSPR